MPPCLVCSVEGHYRCSKCQVVYYCCSDHQRHHWKVHKPLCGVTMQPDPPKPSIPATSRFPEPLRSGVCLYINLDRREDRKRKLQALVKPHEWLSSSLNRIPAVDGKMLRWSELIADRLFTQDARRQAEAAEKHGMATLGPTPQECSPHLTLGGCGCALSHKAAWKELADGAYDWALILEDDITAVADNFDDNLIAVLKCLPKTWEVCYLGFHTGEMLPRGRKFSGRLIPLTQPGVWLAGLWGYLLSKEGAKKLLQDCWPMPQQVDAQVGISLNKRPLGGFTVQPGEFLLFSPPTEDSRDTDVQTFPEQMR
eukprot:gnl/MRDRNA2_/MRDRNA2_81256_c0_seq1.p1 gnl/MRDRNA2_/MRDRNA2_81256_c0~~gnl/MRDRNA2_/MRDRNA2_81256_c0_seq1.p1  ORF type:complete len:320 (+),score=44.74 gnl/MRDRNA2_/MRDRNA2_81256_c0_seq1:28-960(+)